MLTLVPINCLFLIRDLFYIDQLYIINLCICLILKYFLFLYFTFPISHPLIFLPILNNRKTSDYFVNSCPCLLCPLLPSMNNNKFTNNECRCCVRNKLFIAEHESHHHQKPPCLCGVFEYATYFVFPTVLDKLT